LDTSAVRIAFDSLKSGDQIAKNVGYRLTG